MLSSLTALPLPRVRLAVLGLLGAVIGFSAPAREASALSLATPGALSDPREVPINAFYMGPGVSDSAPHATRVSSLGVPPASFQRNADGTTTVTLRWDAKNGNTTERRSALLVLAAMPAPEPTPVFLGACAGCVFLLLRRRAMPSKLRPARVNLSIAAPATARASRLVASASARSARAPRGHRALRRRQRVPDQDATIGRLFPRQPRPSKAVTS